MLRRIFGWAIAAFAAYYVITDPTGAVALVNSALHVFGHVGAALSHALSSHMHR